MTTTALALAGVSGAAGSMGEVLLIEADPAGGDLECWCGPLGQPGLLGAVTSVGGRSSSHRLWEHAVDVVPGVRAIVAPTSEPSVGAALRSAPDAFADAVASLDATVVIDLGRWVSPAPALLTGLLRVAGLVIVVCRPALASVEHARGLVASLHELNRSVAVAVVGGERPYSAEEVSLGVGTRVAGVLPWDSRGVATLVERGASRALLRSRLALAAGEMAEGLGYLVGAHRVDRVHG